MVNTNTIERFPSTIHRDEKKPTETKGKRAGIRRKKHGEKTVNNPYKPKMSVPVNESFKEVIEMNEKALKILAKRT